MSVRSQAVEAPANLIDLLRNQAKAQPSALACAYLGDDGDVRTALSFGELDLNARALGARLQGLDASQECAVLLYSPGLDFITAFFACMYANVVAIPLPIPRTRSNFTQTKAIIEQTKARIVLSTATSISKLHRQEDNYFLNLICVDTQQIDQQLSSAWQDVARPAGHELAYLQYTSGSTSARKGVMISHANVLENIKGIDRGFAHDKNSVAVNWLPHFHDLGLVSGILQPLYHGVANYLMAPSALVQRPIRWLNAISNFKATHTNSPNYAYDLCINKITQEQMGGLDLSAWRIALNGAEPVRADTVREFYQKFSSAGLAQTTMYPAYGLAEATLVVSAGLPKSVPEILSVDSSDLEQGIVTVSANSDNARDLVACGLALDNTVIAIADPRTCVMANKDTVGEIWVSGPGVAAGYWLNEKATTETFAATLEEYPGRNFLRTGDLGFVHDGALYITGREKDLIIIRGANHYPQDIEWTVEQAHGAIKAGCGAAFSIAVDGEEKLLVVYELERAYIKTFELDDIVKAVRSRISQEHDLQLYGLVLLKTASVPRTSSGKIQRRQCRDEFLNDTLTSVGNWIQGTQEHLVIPESSVEKNFASYVSDTSSGLPVEQLSNSAEAIIAWLRVYAEQRLNSQSYDERRAIPPHVLLDFGNRGLLGLQVANRYGGLGLSTGDALKVIEQIGAIDQTLAMMCIVHNTLGLLPIEKSARVELKAQLLPKLASGRELIAFAMTEPVAGSNPRTITSTAVKIAHDKWRLSGEKSWSGTAGWASVINVFAQQIDINGEPRGMIGFCVPVSTPGVTIGPEAKTFGMRGMVQNTVYFDNVVVADTHLLGEPGSGMAVAQHVMQRGRLMIAAACIGGMKRCAQLMTRYGSKRTISTGNLLENGVWAHRLLEISSQIGALESLVSVVAKLEDTQQSVPADVFAALKITAPEYFWQAADSLVQMLGGRGYIDTNIAPQLLRDARVARILEGPTEALQMFLGARVVKDPGEFYRFLESLATPGNVEKDSASNQHASLSETIKRALETHKESSKANHRYLSVVGDLAAHAILLACLRADDQKSSDFSHQASLNWAQQGFFSMIAGLAKLEKATQETELQRLLKNVDSYRHSIGDIEQQLAGFDEALDPLLRRNSDSSYQERKPESAIRSTQDSTLIDKSGETRLDSQFLATSRSAPTLASSVSENPKLRGAIDAGKISGFITDWLDSELKLSPGTVRAQHTFFEHGVDSVVSVMLTVAIEEEFGYLVEPEVIYDYQRIESCSREIAKLMSETLDPSLS